MLSIKRGLGLDLIDLSIHVGVTLCLMAFVGVMDGPEEFFPVITGASLLLLGFRRRWALRRAVETDQGPAGERLAEVEERVTYLEALQDRVMELEERLDFTERLLTRQQNERLPG